MKYTFILVLGLIFGLVILGLATLHQSIVILAAPLAAYLFAAVLWRPENIQLTITRQVAPPFTSAGSPITVTLTVTSQGAAMDEIAIQDVLPTGIRQLEGKSATTLIFAAREETTLEYTITADRGDYHTYTTLVYARDFAGLFEHSFVYETKPSFTVYPQYSKLARIKIRPPQTRGFAGPIASRQSGSGIGFLGVREYQLGDRQRQINWKLSARSSEELFTNIFEQERVADVGIILDARQQANISIAGGSLFEHAISATAALADTFLNDGNRVGLLVYGSGLIRIFPGYGRVQRERILRAVARAELVVNYALESLAYLPTRVFPAKSQIVIVSPLLPGDVPVLARIRAYGYAVMVVSPDPVTYSANYYRDSSSAAYRLAHAERTVILRQLRKSGIQLVNWVVGQSLELAIREELAHQQQMGRMR